MQPVSKRHACVPQVKGLVCPEILKFGAKWWPPNLIQTQELSNKNHEALLETHHIQTNYISAQLFTIAHIEEVILILKMKTVAHPPWN